MEKCMYEDLIKGCMIGAKDISVRALRKCGDRSVRCMTGSSSMGLALETFSKERLRNGGMEELAAIYTARGMRYDV